MEQFHLFKNNADNFLYFTEYKQLFMITNEEYNVLKQNVNKIDIQTIINNYIDKLNKIDLSNGLEYEKIQKYGLFLCISNICNCECSYCFANQGNYGKEKGLMNYEIAKKSIDNFLQIVPSNINANIIFFGGEPLMNYNLIVKICNYIKEYYRDRKCIYSIVTNGTLLNKEMIDFFAENNFVVALSIDGGKEIQDTQRPLSNGKSSYDEIITNLFYLLNSVKSTHARGTYVDFNKSLVQSYKDLISLGFKEVDIPPNFILNMDVDIYTKLINEQLDELYMFILEYINQNDNFPFGLFRESIRNI